MYYFHYLMKNGMNTCLVKVCSYICFGLIFFVYNTYRIITSRISSKLKMVVFYRRKKTVL